MRFARLIQRPSHSGVRSPAKYGSAARPAAPGGVAAASARSSSNGLSSEIARSQLVSASDVAVGPIMMWRPGNTPVKLLTERLGWGWSKIPAILIVVRSYRVGRTW